MGERFPAEPFREHAADGYDVRGQEGGDGEGNDGVEGDRGAKVDQRNDDPEPEGDPERVERDVPAGSDLFNS